MRGNGVGRWTVVVDFPRENREYEFKYVLLKEGEGMWEDGLNRAISVTDSGQAEISHSAQLPHHFRNALNVARKMIRPRWVHPLHSTGKAEWASASVPHRA